MRAITVFMACALAATLQSVPRAAENAAAAAPLTITSARVSLDGTSNIHAFTASTSTVHLVTVEVGVAAAGDLLDDVLKPGGLTAFEVRIPTKGLTSPKEGIDKNMHKALKVEEFPNILFRLRSLEPAAGGGYRAAGSLTIAGVEKDVTLNLQAQRNAAALTVKAATDLLMTDYGITPPKALMGMLKTDPKVQIRIELVLAGRSTT